MNSILAEARELLTHINLDDPHIADDLTVAAQALRACQQPGADDQFRRDVHAAFASNPAPGSLRCLIRDASQRLADRSQHTAEVAS